MAQANPAYETVYILKPSVSDSDATTIHQKVDNVISKFEGKLKHREEWGINEMAYEIHGEKAGRYVIAHYTGRGGVVEEIERHFKILDNVMRFLTVRVADDYEYGKFVKQVNAQ